jgi:hypothetical protein
MTAISFAERCELLEHGPGWERWEDGCPPGLGLTINFATDPGLTRGRSHHFTDSYGARVIVRTDQDGELRSLEFMG